MNIMKLMKQAQQMQTGLAQAQEKLAALTFTSEVAGGKVAVTANGAGEITAIKIDPAIINPDDAEFLQDIILQGCQSALALAKEEAKKEMSKITGGLGLPPGLGF